MQPWLLHFAAIYCQVLEDWNELRVAQAGSMNASDADFSSRFSSTPLTDMITVVVKFMEIPLAGAKLTLSLTEAIALIAVGGEGIIGKLLFSSISALRQPGKIQVPWGIARYIT